MFEDINTHRQAVKQQIQKAFEVGFVPECDFEKARHNVGDIDPSGKFVWTEYAPGKYDWHIIKKPSQKQAERKDTWNLSKQERRGESGKFKKTSSEQHKEFSEIWKLEKKAWRNADLVKNVLDAFIDESGDTKTHFDLEKLKAYKNFLEAKKEKGISGSDSDVLDSSLSTVNGLIKKEEAYRAGKAAGEAEDSYQRRRREGIKKRGEETLKDALEWREKEGIFSDSEVKKIKALAENDKEDYFDHEAHGGDVVKFLSRGRLPFDLFHGPYTDFKDGEVKEEEDFIRLSNKDKIIYKTKATINRETSHHDKDYEFNIYLKKPGSDKLVLLSSGKFEERNEEGKTRSDRFDKVYRIEADAFRKYYGLDKK